MSSLNQGSATSSAPSPSEWGSILATVSQQFAAGVPDDQLRAGLRQWCDEARRRDLKPEQFLPVLKSQILHSPGTRRRTRDMETRDRALQRLVTMCIEEYYADGSAHAEKS